MKKKYEYYKIPISCTELSLYNFEQRTLLNKSRTDLESLGIDHIQLRYRGQGQPRKNM